uniref:Nose resistant to fluoxetine protein 6-like n=1 Tax=Saccoglossus kowalevskii TaxID=10224 RepID=A0ABM0H067_SACKO|nr:PREDICTED: nose resistant to fluoxetine protein 6-like [Saccoglossus kowalevskii]
MQFHAFAFKIALLLSSLAVNAQLIQSDRLQPMKGDDMRIYEEELNILRIHNNEILFNRVHETALQHLDDITQLEDVHDTYEFTPFTQQSYENASLACINDTIHYVKDILRGESYAMRMFDSIGKPPAGILEGNYMWVGSSVECRRVVDVQTYNSSFSGKYCIAAFPMSSELVLQPQVELGLCLPDSCDNTDVLVLINAGLGLVPVQGLRASSVICIEESSLSTGAIVMIVVIGVLLYLMAVGTGYDVYVKYLQRDSGTQLPVFTRSNIQNDVRDHAEVSPLLKPEDDQDVEEDVSALLKPVPEENEHYEDTHSVIHDEQRAKTLSPRPGTLVQCILAFSVLENGGKILDTTHASGTLAAIHGVRVLSMWWVILGHSYSSLFGFSDNISVLPEVLKRFTFQAISNATFSVDTFFFLRLTPVYMFIIFFSTYLLPYIGDGPYQAMNSVIEDPCKTNWWTNLLYINNLVPWPGMEQCYGVAWYLANDMQFHVVSPIIIILLVRWRYSGFGLLTVLMGSTLAARVATGVHYDLTSSMNSVLDPNITGGTYFLMSPYMYTKPWTRIGTYLTGMAVGYALVKTECNFKIPRAVNLICWMAAWVVALSVLYGLYGTFHGVELSRGVDILYLTICRVAWSIAIGWLTFACLTGNGDLHIYCGFGDFILFGICCISDGRSAHDEAGKDTVTKRQEHIIGVVSNYASYSFH